MCRPIPSVADVKYKQWLFSFGVTEISWRVINISEIALSYSEEYRSSLLGLHAFCGCDTTSSFKGKGHIGPIKLIKKFPRFMKPLAQIGNQWNVPTSLVDELEELTCAIYGQQNFSSVDEVRFQKFKEKCGTQSADASRNVDLALLPPCKKILFSISRG